MSDGTKMRSQTPASPMNANQLRQLLERAEKGDTSTLPQLREILQDPDNVDAFGGNLARQVEYSLMEGLAGKNLAVREALLRKLKLLRAELAGSSPSPLERLLTERVVTCWLYLCDREIRFVQINNPTIKQADYWQRAVSHAHRRYLSALRALALVRKLALPALQVNIAKKAAGQQQVRSMDKTRVWSPPQSHGRHLPGTSEANTSARYGRRPRRRSPTVPGLSLGPGHGRSGSMGAGLRLGHQMRKQWNKVPPLQIGSSRCSCGPCRRFVTCGDKLRR
jgi:hypothetical protein